jgi:hypothetical protein
MIIKTSKKEPEKFSCKFCNYNTCKLSNLERHFLTLKHKMIINDNKNEQKGAEKIYDCKWCGKTYKYLSGLCRHKNICSKANNLILVDKDEHVKAKTKAELYDNQKNDIDSLKIAVKKLTDNDIVEKKIINNNLNINIILNDYCKDAMNLTQFVDQIKLTLEDLLYTKNKGYIEGVSNIFIKNLKELEPTQRPIHCLNNKNNILYIKDDNKWEKDTGFQLTKGIDYITKKQISKIKEWELKNPNWQNCEKLTEIYMELIQKIMGSSDINEQKKDKFNIKKRISKNFNISDIEIKN